MVKGKARKTQKKRMSRRGKKKSLMGNIASVMQTVSFSPTTNPSTQTIQKAYNFSLTNCDRAIQVAQGYAYYRIAKIEVIFKPTSDTYAAGAAASVPYLYYFVDKTGTFYYNNVNFNSLRDAGSRPRRFDDKNIRVSFVPNVLTQGFNFNTALAPWAPSIKAPWLPTNANILSATNVWAPNSTEHLGLVFGVEQDYGSPQKYDVDIIYHFQFKKPTYQSATGTVANVRLDMNDLAHPEPSGTGILVQDT